MENGCVVLLAGYRQHGKDTFFRHIAGQEDTYTYATRTSDGAPFVFPSLNYVRVGFADVLKRECADILGTTADEVERTKDEPLTVSYSFKCTLPSNDPPTVRDMLIDHAAYCRALDPDHYARRVCDALSDEHVTVITDFRYPNEYDYALSTGRRVFTARLRREGASVPPMSVRSEHQLDNFYFQIHIDC